MRAILHSEELYSYLQPKAVQRLERARRLAHETGLLKNIAAEELQREIERLTRQTIDPFKLLDEEEAPFLGKYDEFVAPELLRKAFVSDGLDLDWLFGNESVPTVKGDDLE